MSETEIANHTEVGPGLGIARVVANVTAWAVVSAGFALALAGAAGRLGEPGWTLWLSLIASPALVGLGSISYLRRREQLRRESAWDIFVERELERQSEQPAEPVPIGKLVKVRAHHVRRRKARPARV